MLKSIKKVRSGIMQFSVVDLLSFLLTLHRDLPLQVDQGQKLCYRQKYISKVWDYETKKRLWQLPTPIEIDIWSSSEKFEKKRTSKLPFSVKRLVWRSRNLLETCFFFKKKRLRSGPSPQSYWFFFKIPVVKMWLVFA